MECYRVHIPDGGRVSGVTAAGSATAVLPGEYLVHRLRPKIAVSDQALLRFVGAGAAGHDVHVAEESLRRVATLCALPGELLGQEHRLAMAA